MNPAAPSRSNGSGPGGVEGAATSGTRLRDLLETVGLTAHGFAGYWAGYPAGAPVQRDEPTPRGKRFRTYRRSLYRWLKDEQAIEDENAREIVAVANRRLAELEREPLPSDFLVTPAESRRAGIELLAAKLDEVLERLARIEARLP